MRILHCSTALNAIESTTFSVRKKIELFNQILCPQMRVAFKHLHRLVAADGGDFLVGESGFDEAANGLMTEIVEVQIDESVVSFNLLPHPVGRVRTPFPVTTWLAKEDQVCVDRPHWIVERRAEQFGGRAAQRHCSRLSVLGMQEPDDLAVEIDLHSTQVTISEKRIPVSSAIRTIQPIIGFE